MRIAAAVALSPEQRQGLEAMGWAGLIKRYMRPTYVDSRLPLVQRKTDVVFRKRCRGSP